MKYQPYPRYRDSGIEWLGEVPEHWVISALKHKIRLRYGDSLASEIREDGEIEVFGSNGPVGFHCYANTKVPAIVVGRKGSYGKIVWAENGGFVIDTAYSIDSETTRLNLRWVYYELQPLRLGSLSQDTGVPGLARENAYKMSIAVPPLSEQTAIANFLDREISRIDGLIEEKNRFIELLKEKRQALISHAVTKGLDPTFKMKDSRVNWLGDVPEHWSVLAIKRLTNIGRGASPRPIDDPKYFDDDGEYLWTRISDVSASNVYLYDSPQKLSTLGATLSVKLEPESLFLSIAGTVGKACITGRKACIHDGFVYFPNLKQNSKYFFYIFECGELYKGLGKMNTQLNLNTETIGSIKIALPSIQEQTAIVNFLDLQTAKIDALISETKKSIALLKEHRTALISAAVTGKIDVREAA